MYRGWTELPKRRRCKRASAAAICITSVSAYSAQFDGEYFGEGFDAYDTDKMQIADGWSNGGMFDCTWSSANVGFSDGKLNLSIYGNGWSGYTGGECRTNQTFGYGMYDVSMKPAKNDGIVSSFFTYTGPTDGTVWDEIDIEFLGKDTTKVQFNYYTNGVGNHEYLYDLGFDASEGFHHYGFYWGESSITWYVDEKPVYTATKDIPSTPGKIMMNIWNGTGVDSWLNRYNGVAPLYQLGCIYSRDNAVNYNNIGFLTSDSFQQEQTVIVTGNGKKASSSQ